MILDERTEIADATALSTAATGLALIGDQIDIGSATRLVDVGEDFYVVIQITTAVTSDGSATVEFQVVSDAAAAIAVDGSASVHAKTAAVAKATLVAGYTFIIPVTRGGAVFERYLGVLQNVGTAALTAGAVNIFVTKDVSDWRAYADAV